MYKSLLLLCLVGVICAQENRDLQSTLKILLSEPPRSTRTSLNNVQKRATTVLSVSQYQNPEYQPCTTPGGKEGLCVPYFLCDTNNTAIDDGVGIIDIHFQEDKCYSYLDACCIIPDVRKPDNPITPRPDKVREDN